MSFHDHKIFSELCNYLGEDLDTPMCQELKEHVENCPQCKEYLKSMKETVILLKKTSDSEVPSPPEAIRGIMEKIKKKKQHAHGKNSDS